MPHSSFGKVICGVVHFELWWTSFKAKGPSVVAAYVFTVTFMAGNSNFSHLLGNSIYYIRAK